VSALNNKEQESMPTNKLSQSKKTISLMNSLAWEDRTDWNTSEKGNVEIIAVMQWLINHIRYVPDDPCWGDSSPRSAINNFYIQHEQIELSKTKVESRLREMGLCALRAMYNAEKGRD